MNLLKPAGDDELSDAELALVDEVFQTYRNLNKWQLRDLTHNEEVEDTSCLLDAGDCIVHRSVIYYVDAREQWVSVSCRLTFIVPLLVY